MNTITLTKLYELFAPKLGKEASEGLCTYLETKSKVEMENNNKLLATKEDLAKLETKLEVGLSKLETKLEVGLSKFEIKIGKDKAEVIKWMFIFWIGQVVSICGIMFLFVKK